MTQVENVIGLGAPCDVFAALAGLDHVAFLDSSDAEHPESRYSVVAAMPSGAYRSMARLEAPARRGTRAAAGPYTSGAIGFISYEAGELFERLPARAPVRPAVPRVCFDRYDALLVYDHARSRWAATGTQPARERLLRAASGAALCGTARFAAGPIRPQFTRRQYLDRVRCVRRHIRDGDIYQANFTMSFTAPFEGDAAALYLALRRVNPAPYSAFLRTGGIEILSFSPELFLRHDGRTLETHPIKGTIRRSGRRDDAARHRLCASGKEQAELAMIVDVERNDLSRICVDVNVDDHGRVESFAGLYHTLSTVRGVPHRGVTPRGVLQATFPGGSITGAPKIRAMEILAELEREERGVYTGAIGYIGRDGRMVLNMAIRTIVIGDGILRFNSGGGITWDSDPDREYSEMLAKVEIIQRVLIRASSSSSKCKTTGQTLAR